MPFYEVIYETGSHSVMQADTDEEMLEAVREQHRRAVAGESGGPHGTAAERVTAVLRYDDHPGNMYNNHRLTSAEVKSEVTAFLKEAGDTVNVMELAAAVRDMTNPQVESEPHESNYKMQEVQAFEPSKWGAE